MKMTKKETVKLKATDISIEQEVKLGSISEDQYDVSTYVWVESKGYKWIEKSCHERMIKYDYIPMEKVRQMEKALIFKEQLVGLSFNSERLKGIEG